MPIAVETPGVGHRMTGYHYSTFEPGLRKTEVTLFDLRIFGRKTSRSSCDHITAARRGAQHVRRSRRISQAERSVRRSTVPCAPTHSCVSSSACNHSSSSPRRVLFLLFLALLAGCHGGGPSSGQGQGEDGEENGGYAFVLVADLWGEVEQTQ